MLVFIDESGCPGMKLEGGASRHFTVTLVAFEEDAAALDAERRIEQLRRDLRFHEQFEFHFNKLRPDFREAFMRAIAPCDFFYFSITINKERLHGPGFQYPGSFYKYACGLVFENAKPYLSKATVVIDGSGSRQFQKQLSSYLRRRINDRGAGSRYIKKIKIQNSASNQLLQMADMICGAVARHYSAKEDSNRYREIISHREIYAQFWPK